MSAKAWIIFGVICVVVFGGLVVYSGRDRVDVSKVDTNKIQSASKDSGDIGDHVFGKADAKVVLVEYGDFQCPGCGAAHPIVRTLTEKYQDNMAFVFRNFPLTQIHPNARAAAAAVEAAGKNGRYWEVHNQVFESQDEWSSASAKVRSDLFASYADRYGVTKDKLNTTLNDQSASINRKINFDLALGRKLGVSSTPTFYLNGKKLGTDSFKDAATFEKTLMDEFEKQGITLPESTETLQG